MRRGCGKHAAEVLLGGRRVLIGKAALELLDGAEARHDRGHGRARKAVLDALRRGHGCAEGGLGGVEQAAAGEGLHDRNAHAVHAARTQHLLALGVDVGQGVVVMLDKQRLDVLGRRQHVERRIHREHDHLDLGIVAGDKRDLGVVGRKADVVDVARRLLCADVVDEGAVHDGLELVDRVDIVDEAELDVAAEALKQKLPRRHDLVQVARTHILAILPGGSKVALDHPVVALLAHGCAQRTAHRRVRHPAVDDVDAGLGGATHDLAGSLGVVAADPLGAVADLTYLHAGLAQLAVLHESPYLLPRNHRGSQMKPAWFAGMPRLERPLELALGRHGTRDRFIAALAGKRQATGAAVVFDQHHRAVADGRPRAAQ